MSRHPLGCEHHDRRPLLRRHMTPVRVLPEDVLRQLQPLRENSRLRFELQQQTGSIPMPPVHDLVADYIDRLQLPLLPNIFDQGLERFGVHVTTEGRKGVAGESSIRHSSSFAMLECPPCIEIRSCYDGSWRGRVSSQSTTGET